VRLHYELFKVLEARFKKVWLMIIKYFFLTNAGSQSQIF